jgi:chemotaxis protein CheX
MPPKLDVGIINPFIEATLQCLQEMAGLRPRRAELYLKRDARMLGDINGVIGMANGLCGSCVVSLPTSLAERIVAALLGEDCTGNEALVQDGIGEVANMIAGGAKRRFHDADHRFDISTPTVIAGHGPLEMHNPKGSICVCCEFQAHPDWPERFAVEVAVIPIR